MKTEITYKLDSFTDACVFKDLLTIAGINWHFEERKKDVTDGIYFTTEKWVDDYEIVLHNIDPANYPEALNKIADFLDTHKVDFAGNAIAKQDAESEEEVA